MMAPLACYAVPRDEPTQSNCLQCHAEHARGEHVHAAVIQGCTNCHSLESTGDLTRVALKKRDSGLCQQCHAPQRFERVHLPYALGMCTRCHDPHTSSNPMLLRRRVNELCLECHLANSDDAPSHDLPTIDLSPDNTIGHPYERYPVSGYVDPIRGGEMSCISCHMPHGGNMLHYLKMGSEIPEDALNRNSETKDMCHMCHLRLWGLEGSAKGKKKKRN
jgi:predicted CXXCH cytochrome family protein